MANIVACYNNKPIQSQISRKVVKRCTIHGTDLSLFIYLTALSVIKNYTNLKHKLYYETKKILSILSKSFIYQPMHNRVALKEY